MHAGRLGDSGTLSCSIKHQLDRMDGDVLILLLPFKQPLVADIFSSIAVKPQGSFGTNGVAILAALAIIYPLPSIRCCRYRSASGRAVFRSLAIPKNTFIIRITLCLRFFVTEKRDSTSEISRTTGSFLLLRGCLIFSTASRVSASVL